MIFPELFIPTKKYYPLEEPFNGASAALASADSAEDTPERILTEAPASLEPSSLTSMPVSLASTADDSLPRDVATFVMILLSLLAGALLLILTGL